MAKDAGAFAATTVVEPVGAAVTTWGSTSSGRPPHDIEAEKAVLSAILLDNDAIHAVVTEVGEDFYHPSHQILYRSMARLRTTTNPST